MVLNQSDFHFDDCFPHGATMPQKGVHRRCP